MRNINPLIPLKAQITQCNLCQAHLPFQPKPVFQAHHASKLLIIGQAPSLKVQETGILWNDASGKRLMEWLGITPEILYNENKITILPMGFCYPGKDIQGDLPPRKECAPAWHPKLLSFINPQMTLLIGNHAQRYYLKEKRKKSLTETVRAWKEYQPYIPLPHPTLCHQTFQRIQSTLNPITSSDLNFLKAISKKVELRNVNTNNDNHWFPIETNSFISNGGRFGLFTGTMQITDTAIHQISLNVVLKLWSPFYEWWSHLVSDLPAKDNYYLGTLCDTTGTGYCGQWLAKVTDNPFYFAAYQTVPSKS